MAQYAVLITWREILGKEPELAHLHALLAKYQRKEVLFLLAKLNCLLGTWQNALDFDVDSKLTTDDLVKLNKRADIDKEDPDALAKEWLTDHGFL